MNKHHDDDNKIEQHTFALGPGQRLRQARELADMTLEQVAQRLRLSARIIEAIEEDDYSQTPAHAFVKGYLRAYSKLVSVSGDDVVAEFEALQLPEQLEIDRAVLCSDFKQNTMLNSRSMRVVTFFIGITLLILVTTWWYGQRTLQLEIESQSIPTMASQGAIDEAQSNQADESQGQLANASRKKAIKISDNQHSSQTKSIMQNIKQTNYKQHLQMDFDHSK